MKATEVLSNVLSPKYSFGVRPLKGTCASELGSWWLVSCLLDAGLIPASGGVGAPAFDQVVAETWMMGFGPLGSLVGGLFPYLGTKT